MSHERVSLFAVRSQDDIKLALDLKQHLQGYALPEELGREVRVIGSDEGIDVVWEGAHTPLTGDLTELVHRLVERFCAAWRAV